MQKITLLFFTWALISCTEENPSSEKIIPVLEDSTQISIQNPIETINKETSGEFIIGLWKPKSIIDSLKNGHLMLSEDWRHYETFEENSVKNFRDQGFMDFVDYDLSLSQFGDYGMYQDGEVMSLGLSFNNNKVMLTNLEGTIELMKIPQESISKEYYFHGNYKVEHGEHVTNVTLDKNGSMLGFVFGDHYNAHYGYSEPTFEVLENDEIQYSFILKDTDTGFELYDCTNCEEIDGIDFQMSQGELKYSFVKK